MFSIHYFAESASVVFFRFLHRYSDLYRRFRGTFSIHIKVEEKNVSIYKPIPDCTALPYRRSHS